MLGPATGLLDLAFQKCQIGRAHMRGGPAPRGSDAQRPSVSLSPVLRGILKRNPSPQPLSRRPAVARVFTNATAGGLGRCCRECEIARQTTESPALAWLREISVVRFAHAEISADFRLKSCFRGGHRSAGRIDAAGAAGCGRAGGDYGQPIWTRGFSGRAGLGDEMVQKVSSCFVPGGAARRSSCGVALPVVHPLRRGFGSPLCARDFWSERSCAEPLLETAGLTRGVYGAAGCARADRGSLNVRPDVGIDDDGIGDGAEAVEENALLTGRVSLAACAAVLFFSETWKALFGAVGQSEGCLDTGGAM